MSAKSHDSMLSLKRIVHMSHTCHVYECGSQLLAKIEYLVVDIVWAIGNLPKVCRP
jgi:hypothetical protein